MDAEKTTCRAFFAFDLDPDSARRAAEIRAEIRAEAGAPRASWTNPGAMHVTLKFLGDIETALAPRLAEAILPLASGPAPRLRAGRLTAFPSPGRGRVVIIPLLEKAEQDDILARMAAAAEERSVALGCPPHDHPQYKPHVTLARLKAPHDCRKWLARAASGFEVRLVELVLYRSDSGPDGPIYTAMARARFTA